ncbi:MAG: GNAT family N-acetyltransferase, partial [Nocardioidaceae bacterium]
ARPDDLSAVLALNHGSVELLAPMDAQRLDLLRAIADRFEVVEVGDAVAGFVLTFRAGTSYDSANYRWFGDRHDDFYYLDRIVFDPAYRRRGLATLVYDAMETRAKEHGRMCLEVNVEPPNEASLAFHASRGYTEVGRLGFPDHAVALMEKPL